MIWSCFWIFSICVHDCVHYHCGDGGDDSHRHCPRVEVSRLDEVVSMMIHLDGAKECGTHDGVAPFSVECSGEDGAVVVTDDGPVSGPSSLTS